jgi:ABC-2 type transport system permease protein
VHHVYATQLAIQANNAILTLALYPRDISEGVVRFLMLTIIPAAFVGAIPMNVVRELDWTAFLGLLAFAIGITLLMRLVFYTGLRRYESGIAMNLNL